MPSMQDLMSKYQPQSPDYATDIAKSAAAGVGKTMANVGGELATQGPIGALADLTVKPIVQGATRLAGAGYEAMGGQLSEPWAHLLTYTMGGDPASSNEKAKQMIATQAIPEGIKEVSGADMNYQPETKAGEYAQSVGSNLPYMAMGIPAASAVGMGVGSQAGKDVASEFTDNPKYQEAASVVGGGAGALASPAMAAKGVDLLKDESTSGVGKIGLPTGTTSANEPVNVPVKEMKALAQLLYESLDKSGGQMGQKSWDAAVDDAISKGGVQTAKGKIAAGDNHVTDYQEILQNLKGSPTSIQELGEIDDNLRDRINQAFRQGADQQAASLMNMRDTLRSASKNVNASDITNPQAFADWQKADKIWTAYRTAKDIQDGIANAQNADVPSTAIKNYFKNFVKNEDNLAPLTDEEVKAAKNAAQYGVVTRALKTAGSRLGGHIVGTTTGAMIGAVGGGGVGAALGAPIGYMAGEAVTAPIGAMANARQAAKGQNVINLIGQRPEVQAEARAARGLPAITPPTSAAPMMPTIPGIGAALGGAAQQAQQALKPATSGIGQQNMQELQKVKPQSANPNVQSFAKAESGGNPNAKNPNSSASGLYQFTNKTWADMVMKHGKETGIGIGDKNNPQAQAVMASLYAKDNIPVLEKTLGRMPTVPELYMAHVLGGHGASKLLSANPGQEAIMSFPRQVSDANRPIFYDKNRPRTVAEVQQLLTKKVSA